MKKMYHTPWVYPYPYASNIHYGHYPMYQNNIGYPEYWNLNHAARNQVQDYGRRPFVIDINDAAKQNTTYRTALWTGKHLQVTLMSLNVGEDIGLEIHPNVDQFLRIEQGHGVVQMGSSKNNLNFVQNVNDDFAIMIPAGTWHNVTNTGNIPLKLYSIYAPPQHPPGTVHLTKAQALSMGD